MKSLGYYSILVCFMIQFASATVVLNPFSLSFPDLPAKSAMAVGASGVCGALHVAIPLDACSPLLNPRKANETWVEVNFALVKRGECSFDEKIRHAQAMGFRAVIVYDNESDNHLIHMMIKPDDVKVHAVFVSNTAGEKLKSYAREITEECCIYPSHLYRPWTVLAISLISLSLVFAFLVAVFVTSRRWRNNRYERSNSYNRSVDRKVVESLPSVIFKCSCQRQEIETCAICLEDYKDGDVLRLLPCHHDFHSKCVDSWLTNWGTFCPICKLGVRTDSCRSKV